LIFSFILRKPLISKLGLTQVVDFHDIFRYFPIFPVISNSFLVRGKRGLAEADLPRGVENAVCATFFTPSADYAISSSVDFFAAHSFHAHSLLNELFQLR